MVWRIRLNTLATAQRAQQIVLFAIVTAGVWVVGYNAYGDWALKAQSSAPAAQAAPTGSVRQQLPISQLVEAHLFGQRRKAVTAAVKEAQVAPETRLRLQLRGVFAHSDPTQSRALVAEQGKSAKYYRLGDSLASGAILHAVATEHVVLDRNNQLETLSFNANKSASGKRQVATRTTPNQRVKSFLAEPAADAAKKIASTQQRTESIKDRLMRLREARDL